MVSFQEVGKSPSHVALRCAETGVVYSLDWTHGSYVVRNSGVVIGSRADRVEAMTLLRQTAELDFRTVQGDCGQYSA